jgi:hypothetical protein
MAVHGGRSWTCACEIYKTKPICLRKINETVRRLLGLSGVDMSIRVRFGSQTRLAV